MNIFKIYMRKAILGVVAKCGILWILNRWILNRWIRNFLSFDSWRAAECWF